MTAYLAVHRATRSDIVLFVLIGVAFAIAGPFLLPVGFAMLWLAVTMFGVAYSFYLRDVRVSGPEKQRQRRERTADGIRIHGRCDYPLSRLIPAVMLSLSCAAGTRFFDGEPEAPWLWATAGACLVIVPDTLRALRRRPRLTLDQAGLRYRGWSVDIAAAWPQILRTYPCCEGSPQARIVMHLAEGATYRRRFLLSTMEPRSRGGTHGREAAIAMTAFDSPIAVADLIGALSGRFGVDPQPMIDIWFHVHEHYSADAALATFRSEAEIARRR